MKLQIEYDKNLAPEYHDLAKRSLENSIVFLEGIPRPAGYPESIFLTPDFEEMQFLAGNHTYPHGLFNRRTMKGWCVFTVRTNGDLVIDTTPPTTFTDCDIETSCTASLVYLLDQYFIDGTYPELHLSRQLAYLDSVASSNAKAKSLLDQYEQIQADKLEQEKQEAYKRQLAEKRRLYFENRYKKWVSKVPAWYAAKYPDSPILDGPHEIIGASAPPSTNYTPPRTQYQQVVTTTPTPAPPPELTAFQEQIIREQQALWGYVASRANTCEPACEVTETNTENQSDTKEPE